MNPKPDSPQGEQAVEQSVLGAGVLPGRLEAEHHRLMECRADTQVDDSLETDADRLIAQLRQLGTTLEDAQQRRRCQKIADFWGIHLYRFADKDVDTELLPFDPNTSTPLCDAQFPYNFEDTPPEDATARLQGWRRLLDECEHCLVKHRLLAVVSDPGSGGKFLLHRMFVPRLKAGATRQPKLAGSDHWQYYEVTFDDRPLHSFLHALALENDLGSKWVRKTLVKVQADPSSVREHLEPFAASNGVIIVRQAHRLLTLEAAQRQTVCEVLEQLVSDPRASWNVLLSMNRADATRLAEFQPLSERLRNGHVLLAFTTAELRHLIVEPAQAVGLSFEPGLVDQLLIDIQGESTALPLLQFTLRRLWERRERNRIAWDGYRQVGAGRVALSKAMDEVYQPLDDIQQKALRHILTTMVLLVPGGTFICRQATRRDLADPDIPAEAIDRVLQQLLAADMLYETPGEAEQYQLKYPALLDAWQPLAGWLEEARVEQSFRLRLRAEAERWQRKGRSDDLLWRGWELQNAENRLAGDRSVLEIEQEFLTSGRRRERRKTVRQWLAGSMFALLLLTILVGVPLYQRQEEKRRRMLDNATESMRTADISGELLWLNAYSDVPPWSLGNSFLRPDDIQTQMASLARMQTPELAGLFIAREGSEARSMTKAGVDNAASSLPEWPISAAITNGWIAALVTSDPACGPDVEPYQVCVRPFEDSREPFSTDWFGLTGRKHEATFGRPATLQGNVRFVALNSDTECLLAAAGGLLAWNRTATGWSAVDVHFAPRRDRPVGSETQETYQPHSFYAAGRFLVTAVQHDAADDKREWRLWKMAEEIHKERLELREVELPTFFREKSADQIQQVVVSANASLIALCGGSDQQMQELRVWTAAGDGKERQSWTPFYPPPWFLGLQQSNYQRVFNWGWQPTQQNNGWKRMGASITSVSFAASEARFVTTCNDGQVLIWELSTASESPVTVPLIESKLRLGSKVNDATFLTDNILATAGRDRTARFWNIHNGTEVLPPIYHRGTVNTVVAGSPGWLLTRASGSINVFRSDSLRQLAVPNQLRHWALDMTHGKLVSAPIGSTHPSIAQYVSERQVPGAGDSEPGDRQTIGAVALSDTGQNYAWLVRQPEDTWQVHARPWDDSEPKPATQRGTIRVAKPDASGASLAPLLRYAPDDHLLAVVPQTLLPKESSAVQLYQVQSPASRAVALMFPNQIMGLTVKSFAVRDAVFVSGQPRSALVLLGQVQYNLDSENETLGTAGGVLLAFQDRVGGKDSWQTFWLVDKTDDKKEDFPHFQEVLCAGFSPNGRYLATGSASDEVKLWDLDTLESSISKTERMMMPPEIRKETLLHSSDVVQLRFASDCDDDNLELVTVSSEGEAILWSIDPSQKEFKERSKVRHEAKILTVEFSQHLDSDSAETQSMKRRWLITGSADRTARVWHPGTGRLVGIFLHGGPVVQASCVIQDDRAVLATVSQLPNLYDKRPIHQLRFWTGAVTNGPLDGQQVQELAARKITEDQMDLQRLLLPGQPQCN